MKKNKYKILLLADLKGSTENIIRNTIGLAGILDAEIELFHVRKPTEIVDQENQLASMRTISRKHVSTAKKIQNLLDKVSAKYNVTIDSSFSFGNVKSEIEKHINNSKPDIVVIGKRRRSPLSISGDNVTDFIIKTFKGSILIASDKNIIDPLKGFSLGLVNDKGNSIEMDLARELIGQSRSPLRSFKIVDSIGNTKTEVNSAGEQAVEFVFEKNDNSIKNLSKYLIKNDINLAYLNRAESNTGLKGNTMMDIIRKIEIPILLSNEQQGVLN